MRSNRKRKDARFPKWILDALTSLRLKYEWNFTEALMRCTEKGINYYEKQWQKLYKSKKPLEGSFQGSTVSSNCQEDNTPEEKQINLEDLQKRLKDLYGPGEKEAHTTDEELDELMNETFGKKKENKK